MTYQEEDGTEKLQGFDEYVKLKKQQAEKERLSKLKSPRDNEKELSESPSKMKIDTKNLFKDRQSGWSGVTNFLLGDPRTRKYVVQQIKLLHEEKLAAQFRMAQTTLSDNEWPI